MTPEDVDIAEKIFGKDVATLKGKSKNPKPLPVIYDVEIPREIKEKHKNLKLHINIMLVNQTSFLTCVDSDIKFRKTLPLNNQTTGEIYRVLDEILRFYNHAGHWITHLQCDKQFKPLMDEVKDELGIEMNYTTKGDHEHEAERNIETIKERVRTAYHCMPYPAIPNVMTKRLCVASTDQLNLFPAKGGVSAYYSPHVIMTGQDFDYNKHCQVPFGAHVQANKANDPTNTNAPRTIDAIYLVPMPNARQGGHLVMNLVTGRETTATKVTEIPVTEHVINTVAKMAEQQGIKTLKITGRNKEYLHPAHWVAGVDYDNNNQNQSKNDDDNDEDYNPDEEIYPGRRRHG